MGDQETINIHVGVSSDSIPWQDWCRRREASWCWRLGSCSSELQRLLPQPELPQPPSKVPFWNSLSLYLSLSLSPSPLSEIASGTLIFSASILVLCGQLRRLSISTWSPAIGVFCWSLLLWLRSDTVDFIIVFDDAPVLPQFNARSNSLCSICFAIILVIMRWINISRFYLSTICISSALVR